MSPPRGSTSGFVLDTLLNPPSEPNSSIKYEWVRSHQDDRLPWQCLTLEGQLNSTCNKLANNAVTRALSSITHPAGPLMLPFENIAIVINNKKIMPNIAPAVCFALGKEEAKRFHTKSIKRVQDSNKGGLGWTEEAFNKVDWKALECTLTH